MMLGSSFVICRVLVVFLMVSNWSDRVCVGECGAGLDGNCGAELNEPPINKNSKHNDTREHLLLAPAKLRLHPPPILYSIPGCGNTWVRMQLDKLLGVDSGSMYNDMSLKQVLKAEFTCGNNVSMVKAHPHLSPFDDLFVNGSRTASHTPVTPGTCVSEIDHFDAVIVLTRDPFRSIFAEYRRQHGKTAAHATSHTSSLPIAHFRPEHFAKKAIGMARSMVKIFGDLRRVATKLDPTRVLFVRFEDFANPRTRAATLRRVYRYLTNQQWSPTQEEDDRDRNRDDRVHNDDGDGVHDDGDEEDDGKEEQEEQEEEKEQEDISASSRAYTNIQELTDKELLALTTADAMHRLQPTGTDVTFDMVCDVLRCDILVALGYHIFVVSDNEA